MKMFDTELFISEVEKRPALYDARDKEYSDRELKYKLWDEIAAVMYKNWGTLPGQECRKKVKELRVKWKSIRDHFRKEVGLEKKYRAGQGNLRKKRKYIYYDQLLFLLTEEEKETLSAVRIKEEIHTSPSRILEEDLELEDYDTMDYSINPSMVKQEDTKSSSKRTQQKTPNTTAEEIALGQVQEVRYITEDTMGNKDFLMSLLPLMNKLPDYAIVHLRLKIMELFQLFSLPNSEQYANYQAQQQQQQQQYSYPTSTIVQATPNTSSNNPSTSTPMSPNQVSASHSGDNSEDSDMSDSSSDKS